MLQSSPSHVRVPQLARTRAKVALILTSVAPSSPRSSSLTSHLNAQAATPGPRNYPVLSWTPASARGPPQAVQIVHGLRRSRRSQRPANRALTDSGITGITDGTGAAPSTNAVSLTKSTPLSQPSAMKAAS